MFYEDKKILTGSETKNIGIVEAFIIKTKKKNGGGGQASYNLPNDFFKRLLDEGYLVEFSNKEHTRNGGTNFIYSLNNEYRLMLEPSVLKYVGEDVINPRFLVTYGNGNKPQIRPSDYKNNLNINDGFNYSWFITLYSKNLENNIMKYKLSTIDKTLSISIDENQWNNTVDNVYEEYDYEIDGLEDSISNDKENKVLDLSEEFLKYLKNVTSIEKSTANNYIGALRGQLIDEIKKDVGYFYIYSISNLERFNNVLNQIYSSEKFFEINEKSHRRISSSLEHYRGFLKWRKKPHPHQRIFFGAPGTGKSYKLNEEAREYFGDNYERVTFHPNYMYGHFVGAFKPFPKFLKNSDGSIKKDDDGNIQETITYEYIPGILMKQLVKALKNQDENYLLLIEEINRANVAAVFGDVFQLLDRNNLGESEYFIATSRELQEFLKKEFNDYKLDETVINKLGSDFSRLYLPKNLYIWATMNSADQGVMPMDTAFRRRWEFKYLGINEAADLNKEDFKRYKFKINDSEVVLWDEFRRALNKKLSSLNIPEDKLIGPYFVSKSILEETNLNKLTDTIKNKVLMYLYEDVAKSQRKSLFAKDKHSTYSDVCKYFDDNALLLFDGNLNVKTESIDQGNTNYTEQVDSE